MTLLERVRTKLALEVAIFVFPVVLLMLVVIMKVIWGVDNWFWDRMLGEDNPVEWMTFLWFFFSFLIGAMLCRRLWMTGERLASLFYVAVSLFCLFVALEEISYGQRIFDLKTPTYMMEFNDQEEITIHNIGYMWFISFYLGPMAVGLFGTFGWVAIRLIPAEFVKARDLAISIMPPWFVSMYFLPTVIFVSVDYNLEGEWDKVALLWWKDHELFEFLFGLGFFFYIGFRFLPFLHSRFHALVSKGAAGR